MDRSAKMSLHGCLAALHASNVAAVHRGLARARVVLALLALGVLVGESSMGMPIPQEVKNVVTFVFVPNEAGQPVPNGTGFFVSVKNESDASLVNVYLATAKHVFDDKNGQRFPRMWIRLNKRGGGAEYGEVDLSKVQVFTHRDNTVDIAVVPLLPSQEKYEFKAIPDDMLTTKESFGELGIAEGSDVFFTGLFTAHYGQEHNYPIVRFGRVALLSGEKVFWRTPEMKVGELRELYLIETQSYGGNSGSPVFFYLGADRTPGMINLGPPVVKLAGVMSGSFQDAQPIQVVQTAGPVPISLGNAGIAAVVPSYLLHELLFSDELKTQRRSSKKTS